MKITISEGWLQPVCPFCKSELKLPEPTTEILEEDVKVEGVILKAGTEIKTGYTAETCKKCKAVFSVDCDELDLLEDVTNAEFFTVHNFKEGLYHPHLSENFDMIYPDLNLGHLEFARIKDGIYDLENNNPYLSMSEVLKITGYSDAYYRKKFIENPEVVPKLKILKDSSGWRIPREALEDKIFKKKDKK